MGRYKRRNESRTAAMELFGTRGNRKMESPEDRRIMMQVLRHSSDRRIREMIDYLSDEVLSKNLSFVAACHKYSIPWQDIAKEFKNIRREQGLVGLLNQIPNLLHDMAFDAKSRWEICPRCKGDKQLTEDGKRSKDPAAVMVECKHCDGSGKKYYPGDVDKLRMALESAEIIGKNRVGILNQIINVPGQNETMEDLMGDLGQLIEGEVK